MTVTIRNFMLIITMALTFITCRSKFSLDDIDIDEIVAPCDCSDGMAHLAEYLLDLTKNYNSREEVEKNFVLKSEIDLVNQKVAEVSWKCEQLGVNDPDIKDCPSFKVLEETSKELNSKFR